jgi:hypothetical protein
MDEMMEDGSLELMMTPRTGKSGVHDQFPGERDS